MRPLGSTRSFVVLALAAGALLGAACTNDYDALLDQASGGGSGASTSDAASTSTDASSSSGGPASSTTTSSVSASSASSAGGDGDGGNGDGGNGDGGNGDGGGGNGGGSNRLPGAGPCELTLPLDEDIGDIEMGDDALPAGWNYAEIGDPRSSIADDTFIVRVGANGFNEAALYTAIDGDTQLVDCSITTEVVSLDGTEANTELSGFLGLFRDEDYLARIRIVDGDPWHHEVLLGDNGDTTTTADGEEDGDPPRGIRIRAHDDEISFDVETGQGWTEIHTISRGDLGQIKGIAIGATRKSPANENDDTTVVLGPLNPT